MFERIRDRKQKRIGSGVDIRKIKESESYSERKKKLNSRNIFKKYVSESDSRK